MLRGLAVTRALTKSDDKGGAYQGTMRVKFGPTVAQFRGEARLTYDHAARRCSIEGRGIDGRGASRANATRLVEAMAATRLCRRWMARST